MAKKKTAANGSSTEVNDYRHTQARRKNNPPAKIAAEGTVPAIPKARYEYNPHLPPMLRFDPAGAADQLPRLLEKATQEKLTPEEARTLADHLRRHEPWLEWSGKREAKWFEVDPVALHIHERISAQAILKVAARQDVERSLFGDPQQAYHEAVQFYRHDIDWTNRMILGDSLAVMSSLAKREDLAGKVQMIYLDPPYGIKFASNFQPEVGKRDVKDKQEDLTREPEMVKAYRDTWQLGIHSYLSYLRDRLMVAKELLADTGSIFVQISDENIHRVRHLLDEVFGIGNHVATITYKTAIGMASELIDPVHDYVLWYARDREQVKFRRLYQVLKVGGVGASRFKQVESTINGEQRLMSDSEREAPETLSPEWRPYRDQGLTSRSGSVTTGFEIEFGGRTFRPPSGGWRSNAGGIGRVMHADRLLLTGDTISYKKFLALRQSR